MDKHTKTIFIKGEVMFSSLVKPRQSQSGNDSYGIVLKMSKKSEALQKFAKDFKTFCTEAKVPVKTQNKNQTSQKDLLGWYVTDGDTHEYWNQHESNHGYKIFQLKAPKPAIVNLKKGDSFIRVSREEVYYGDQVLAVCNFVKSKTDKGLTYFALFLSEVLILEKGAADFSDNNRKLLEEETGLSFVDSEVEKPEETKKKKKVKAAPKPKKIKPSSDENLFDDVDEDPDEEGADDFFADQEEDVGESDELPF